MRTTNYTNPEVAAAATPAYEADRLGSIRRDRTKVVDKSLKVVGFMYARDWLRFARGAHRAGI